LAIPKRPWDEALNILSAESRQLGRMFEKERVMDCDWTNQYEAYWDAALARLVMVAEQKVWTKETSLMNVTLDEPNNQQQDSLRRMERSETNREP
jgi:hypothetical protein